MRPRLAVVGLMISLLVLVGCPNGTAELWSVTPNKISVGAQGIVLRLTGKNFTNPVVVVWNGKEVGQLVTTLVDSQHLTAVVPTSFVAIAGVASVTALQSGQNQTVTQPLTIVIGNVAPTLTGITPAHVVVAAPGALTLTLTGTNFNQSSVANWDTTPLATTFVSGTQLTAVVPSSLYPTAASTKITVTNAGGGGSSATMIFTVVARLSMTTTSLPGGSLGVPYTATLVAAGGATPYTWSITTGSLPVGLTLNPTTGVISGTPTAAGSSSFTVQIVDSTGALARRRF